MNVDKLDNNKIKNMQNTIVASPNVQGNIGSCEVKKTIYSVDSWHTGVILQDSCTGNLIGRNEYYDWGPIYFPAAIVIVIVLIGTFFRTVLD